VGSLTFRGAFASLNRAILWFVLHVRLGLTGAILTIIMALIEGNPVRLGGIPGGVDTRMLSIGTSVVFLNRFCSHLYQEWSLLTCERKDWLIGS